MTEKILVLCTGNSCRSQIAEGYLKHFAKEKAEVYSAGIEVHGVNPKAVETMKEDGIDISNQTSNNVSEYALLAFDHVITVCDNAHELCPVFHGGVQKHHQDFSDPAKATGTDEEIKASFASTRNLIKEYMREFVLKYF